MFVKFPLILIKTDKRFVHLNPSWQIIEKDTDTEKKGTNHTGEFKQEGKVTEPDYKITVSLGSCRKLQITLHSLTLHSGHDPKVLKEMFTGFIHRAYTMCENRNLKNEIIFLLQRK